MTDFFRRGFARMLAAPAKLMHGSIRQNIQHSDSSKILTDANGNASLNMNNQHVRESMRARMEELARER
ncbi:hypothetical protein AAGQ96_09330 [Pantoea sp. MBD-2R]|uniref:hypothetical protein n=1 Tax=unclassified Pantoea TaxID=2630326 RepID=UPI0011BE8095|nr:hypothetical protein [Pantoea sp. CCBC3-3-1]